MALDKLVDSTQLDSDLTSVANAIRTKGGTSAQLAFPAGFVSAIGDIPSGGGSSSGTVTVVNNKAVIPRVSGKSNFFAYVDADSSYFTEESSRVFAAFKINWISSTTGYILKSSNTNVPPSVYGGGYTSSIYMWIENANDITLSCSNKNTAGLLPNGTTVFFIWW